MPRGKALWAAILLAWLALAGLARAAAVPAPEPAAVQDASSRPLPPAERQRLEEAVRAHSGPEQYKILIIDSSQPQDLTAYLDAVVAAWGLPANQLLLVVASQDQHRIRFALGTDLTAKWGVSVDFMLQVLQQHYNPAVAAGRPVDGLVALVEAVHRQVVAAGGSPPPAAPAPAPAPKEPWRVPWPSVSLDLWDPLLPWVLAGSGALLLTIAFVSYVIRLHRWNRHLQARLQRVLIQKELYDRSARE